MSHPELSPEGLIKAKKERKEAGDTEDRLPALREAIRFRGGRQKHISLERLPQDGGEVQQPEKPGELLLQESY